MDKKDALRLRYRIAPLEMPPSEFRKAGRQLVERIAEYLCTLPDRSVTPSTPSQTAWSLFDMKSLPEQGTEARDLIEEVTSFLFSQAITSGHPRFLGFGPSSAAPIGALGELLTAAVKPYPGGWPGAPMGTAIEVQTIRWIAELIGYPPDCGGLLVSGSDMSNFAGLLAARQAKSTWEIHTADSMGKGIRQLRMYASSEAHTWIHKAADTFGMGTDAIRWIAVDTQSRMDPTALRNQIQEDIEAGDLPFLVIGTAGTMSTGEVDPLPALAAICRECDLWFHVDGTYGAFAALLLHAHLGVEVPADLEGISLADSVALAPYTWLYTPSETGCILMRDQQALLKTFGLHPSSAHERLEAMAALDGEDGTQTLRGFRALSLWLALRQVGRAGYTEMIADDIQLAQELYRLVEAHSELQAVTQRLSITTFRYVPPDLIPGSQQVETYLNDLNAELLHRLQRSGEAFLSHAVVRGTFLLRACVMNFRTSLEDIEALPIIVARIGRDVDAALVLGKRPSSCKHLSRTYRPDR